MFEAKDPTRRQFLPMKEHYQAKAPIPPEYGLCNCSQNKPPINPISALGKLRRAKGTKTSKSDLEINYGAGKETII